MSGKVYLVGAGPSDAGLFTLKGLELLKSADVIVYDALVGVEVMGLIPENTPCINVGKHAGNHPVPQEEINNILVREALSGKCVVRLKGGDPFLFGRGGEELEQLVEAGIAFEIVPGVPSAIAVPAYAGIPVTHRDYCSSLHIITGHQKSAETKIDYDTLVRLDGTLVFLMCASSLNEICNGLVSAGMDTQMPAAILERGTTAHQKRTLGTISTLPDLIEHCKSPTMLVVGWVCALAETFSWAEKRSLGRCRIVVTRPRVLCSKMATSLRELGAEVLELPSICANPIEPNWMLDAALNRITDYRWLALTSPTGVRIFMEHLREIHFDIRRLSGLKLASIGASTANAMQSFGLLSDLIPKEYNAEALGKALAKEEGRILIVRAKAGSPALTKELNESGVAYDDIPIYDTYKVTGISERIISFLNAGEIDYVTFTSASTVEGFIHQTANCDYKKIQAICIGTSTEKVAKRYGMQTHIAKEATIASMIELILSLQAK